MKLLALSVALAATLCTCDASLASVTYTTDHKFIAQDGIAENWVAKANLTRKYYQTGYVIKHKTAIMSSIISHLCDVFFPNALLCYRSL